MRKSRKIKQLVAASAVTLALFATVPNSASALVCLGPKAITIPATIWGIPSDVSIWGIPSRLGPFAACAFPTP